jgi:hypothetical protein
MKRRIVPQSQDQAVIQALVDHKKATVDVLVSKIPDRTTFAELADLIGYSHEWVRVRLVKYPEKLFKIGNRYKVPKGVAVEFVRSVFA